MVKVKFLNLLRSKYQMDTLSLHPGTVHEIIDQIIATHPKVDRRDLESAVIFINQIKVMHLDRFNTKMQSNDEIIFTHFVGGG